MSEEEILKIKNLESGYRSKRIIANLNLRLKKGEKIGIKGDNGVGKSTLFKSMFGAAEIFSGDILFKDESLRHNDPWETFEKGIFYMPQEEDVFGSLNIHEHCKLLGIEKEMVTQYLDKDLELLTRNLSGGQKRLLSLLRLVSQRKDLLLLDEPSRSLSQTNIEVLNNIINNLNSSTTLIIIEQDWKSIDMDLDRVLTFSNKGRLED